MSGAEVLDVGRDALWLTIQLCAPILMVGLVVGVGIGLFQALTQIQEQTLSFVPKIIAVAIALVLTGNWVLSELVSFTESLFASLPALLGRT